MSTNIVGGNYEKEGQAVRNPYRIEEQSRPAGTGEPRSWPCVDPLQEKKRRGWYRGAELLGHVGRRVSREGRQGQKQSRHRLDVSDSTAYRGSKVCREGEQKSLLEGPHTSKGKKIRKGR